ncbi:MAG TPA: DnaJ domain-containing protein [Micromonosporaceae bacterium]|jgi:curved DNA-binding protein CbpA|nr:DnaJ domain-containing protein [Micromonosporaceae bacterium]
MSSRRFTHLDGHNAYHVLGVAAHATRAQIEAARRRLAGRVHPDLPGGDAAVMSLVNAAAAILLDDTERGAYDEYLAAPRTVARTEPRPDADRPRPRPSPNGSGPTRYVAPTGRPSSAPTSMWPSGPSARPSTSQPGRPSPTTRFVTASLSATHKPASHRYGDRTRGTWGAAASGPRPPDGGRPGWGAEAPRTPAGSSWRDERSTRPPLRWQPPAPGPLGRWRAARRDAKRAARGEPLAKARNPLVVLGLFAVLVVVCAVTGVLLGFRANFAGGATDRPTSPATSPAHPHPTTSASHK